MQNLLEKQIANGFADFPGLAVSGKIPIKESLLNELLADFLQSGAAPREDAAPAEPKRASDMKQLLKLIRRASVHADVGVITLEFEIGV